MRDPTEMVEAFPSVSLVRWLHEDFKFDYMRGTMSPLSRADQPLRIATEALDAMMRTRDPAVVARAMLMAYLPNLDWKNIMVHVQAIVDNDTNTTIWDVAVKYNGQSVELGLISTCSDLIDEQTMAKLVLLAG
jgi:hypothetical protein